MVSLSSKYGGGRHTAMRALIRDPLRAISARHRRRAPARAGALRILAVTAVITLAACSGEDDTAEPAATPAPTVATTVPASSPTAPSNTPAPTSPTAHTEAATTLPAPTAVPTSSTGPAPTSTATTSPKLDDIQAAVAAAYTASFDTWTACLAALPNCDLATLDPYLTGDYLGISQAQAGRYNDAGQTTSDLDRRELRIESVTVDPSGAQATVQSCEIDGVVRYAASGEVVNDDFESVRRASVLVLEGERWKVAGFENLEAGSTPEDNVCAA